MSLAIQLLGTFQVQWEGKPLKFATDHVRALVAYLATEANIPHPRTTLATLLWPEENESTARHNLRQALVFLRKELRVVTNINSILQVTTTTLQWQNREVSVDLAAFQEAWQKSKTHKHTQIAQCSECLQLYSRAVSLYRGELLHGLLLKNSQPFEEWLLMTREQVHRQAMAMLALLTAHCGANGDFEQMQHYAAQQVVLEPWHEEAHRQLMIAMAALGKQGDALRQFESCRRILKQELGVPPSVETTQLYEKLLNGKFLDSASLPALNLKLQPVTEPVRRSHNLRATLSPLFGRSQQIVELHQRLDDPDQRLITIAGMGGMGKTRIALALMEQLTSELPMRYADGVWFVPLAAIAAPAAELNEWLGGVLLQTIGVTGLPQERASETLLRFLPSRQMLLILDNLEHLLLEEDCAAQAIGFILELLRIAPGVRCIVTSRLPLQVVAESVVRLDGLPVPAPGKVGPRDAINYESVRLFDFHARRTLAGFKLNADNLSDVADICKSLGGMPLAIELAAALTPHFTPAELRAELRHNLTVLSSSRRDLDSRHRQLDALLQSTWQLLSTEEQQTLVNLSIFDGSFGRIAAQAVTGATIEQLAGLVAKSLVQQIDVGIYQLHDLLQQFTSRKFSLLPEASQHLVYRRYVEHYLGLLGDAYPQLRKRSAQKVITQLRLVAEDCRRAWEIALRERWFGVIGASLDGWLRYWRMTGTYHEGETLLKKVLAALESEISVVEQEASMQHLRARLWLAFAHCFLGQERYSQALAAAEKAIELALHCGEPVILAQSDALCAKCLRLLNRHDEVRRHAERAYASGVWEAQVYALITLADFEEDVHAHIAVTAQALQLATLHDDPFLTLQCTQEMAGSYENEGYYAHSLPYRAQVLQLAEEIQDPYQLCEAIYCYGLVHAHLGLYEIALEHFQQALALAEAQRVIWLTRRVQNRLARTHYCLGNFATALNLALQVRQMASSDDEYHPFFDFTYAQILAALLRWQEAEQGYREILRKKRSQKNSLGTTFLPELAALAQLAVVQGKPQQGLPYIEEILDIVQHSARPYTPNLYFDNYAIDLACYEVLHALGDERAIPLLEASYRRLHAQLEQIADPTLCTVYLERPASNRGLHQAYQRIAVIS